MELAEAPGSLQPPEVSAPEKVELAIRVAGLRKRFRKFTARGQYTTIKTSLLRRLFGRRERHETFLQVLDGIDLEVPRGRAIGIIGRNGSGKSTLLKLVAGILKPDAGSIVVDGRVSPLIELGAGFHPEFSGSENIYLNGIVLGLSRAEIDERLDAIIDFAELRECIDDPVRTYSSGMYMRLGFSIAAHAAPDILLVDEILAVGDQAFARKCEEWIAGFLDRGGTLLLVSHDLGAVAQWCHEVLWLDAGQVRLRGSARDVISSYVSSVEQGAARAAEAAVPSAPSDSRIHAVRVRAGDVSRVDHLRPGDTVVVEVDLQVSTSAAGASIDLAIRRTDGVCCYATSSAAEGITIFPDASTVRCRFPELRLLDGSYTVDVALRGDDGHLIDQRVASGSFSIESGGGESGVFRPDHDWEVERGGAGS